MTPAYIWFLLEVAFAIIVPIVIFTLWQTRVITFGVVMAFLWGFLLGYIWESIHALVPGFISLVDKEAECALPTKTLSPVLHAMSDAVMFLLGMLLVYWLELPLRSVWSMLIMVLWGLSTEIIVELVNNGRFWHY